ncbi:hypothetical protein NZK35_18480 [Stieleria sp. ICT_E10.1]|uniref:hypothetical protein n=1 Tax=Stieleria sedimenti TaxID=2976331 RepID=UPI00217F7D08|nr:hypothetical protein [Stieleria sedimenti]MCS7468644.1 hypothetical protein [Stieleria sedimenti]
MTRSIDWGSTVRTIKHCNHVFNAPNPPRSNIRDILELVRAVGEIVKFSRHCCVP